MLCKVCEAKSLPVDIEMCPAKYTIPDGHLIQPEGKKCSIFQDLARDSKVCLVTRVQRLNRKGLSDKRSAVGFCLGSGLFGSYNSD